VVERRVRKVRRWINVDVLFLNWQNLLIITLGTVVDWVKRMK
jgi:hypothetical protein